jgi:hypothetical protein
MKQRPAFHIEQASSRAPVPNSEDLAVWAEARRENSCRPDLRVKVKQ